MIIMESENAWNEERALVTQMKRFLKGQKNSFSKTKTKKRLEITQLVMCLPHKPKDGSSTIGI